MISQVAMPEFETSCEYVSVERFEPSGRADLIGATVDHTKLSRRSSTVTVLAKRNPDGSLVPISPFNGANVASARLSGRKRLKTRYVVDTLPHGAKGEADRKAAEEQGVSERTLRDARRRAETLGADVVERLRETSLRTDTQINALCKLPAAQRRDLMQRAFSGEDVSAVAVLGEARRREAEQANSDEAKFLAAWQAMGRERRLRFLRAIRAELAPSIIADDDSTSISAFENSLAPHDLCGRLVKKARHHQ